MYVCCLRVYIYMYIYIYIINFYVFIYTEIHVYMSMRFRSLESLQVYMENINKVWQSRESQQVYMNNTRLKPRTLGRPPRILPDQIAAQSGWHRPQISILYVLCKLAINT